MKMFYLIFDKDLTEVEIYNVDVSEEFEVKKHGVVPNKSPRKGYFNCRIGDYTETCVNVSSLGTYLYKNFIASDIGTILEYEDDFYGIFKTKEDARKAFAKKARKIVSSLESKLKRTKNNLAKALKTFDGIEDSQNG